MTFYTEAGLDAYAAIKDGSLDMALDRMPENEIGMEKCVCFAKELIREKQCILMAPDHQLTQKKQKVCNSHILLCTVGQKAKIGMQRRKMLQSWIAGNILCSQDWSIRWKIVSSERHMVNRISHGRESSAQTASIR